MPRPRKSGPTHPQLDFPISRYYRNSENDSRNTKVNDSVAIVYDITMFRGILRCLEVGIQYKTGKPDYNGLTHYIVSILGVFDLPR